MAVDAARVKSLFLEASELADPAERAAYLERECGADAGLRQRVEALLAADDGGGRSVEADATGMHESTSPETLDQTPAPDAETLPPSALATGELRSDGADFTIASAPRVDSPGRSGVGQVIAGRYTLREVLGEGGMGIVYRADQTAPVKRQVALKLIKVGMDSRAVLARFDAERQALALMDHPNIARVYDGGTTEAGQPFFVMELVGGVPITDYCDRHRLSVRVRLELFVAVCQAVQHAHQKGIIHRDLKPSNVMVTEVDGRPTPKVIDFGVAKATEFRLTDQSLADTGAIVGTPTYMSPEQADPSSMDIDTRTDIYALGVILYELLVGSPPIDAKQFKRGAILEMLRMVREVDPPRPSTKVSTSDALTSISANRDIEPAHLKRALQGDLDWIVMRALEKDRTRRYETANGFAADILRHLAHEPVVAAPPSRSYRLRKFVRKHRGAVIAASLVLLAVAGGLAATSWQWWRAEQSLGRSNRMAMGLAFKQALTYCEQGEPARGMLHMVDLLRSAPSTAPEYEHAIRANLTAWAQRLPRPVGMKKLMAGYGKVREAIHYCPMLVTRHRIGLINTVAGVEVWDLERFEPKKNLLALGQKTMAMALLPGEEKAMTVAVDGTVETWDIETGAQLGPRMTCREKSPSFVPRPSSTILSPDGKLAARVIDREWVQLWNTATGEPIGDLLQLGAPLGCAAFRPDGRAFATLSATLEIWDTATAQRIVSRSLPPESAIPGSMAFRPDGKVLAACYVHTRQGRSPSVRLWNATTGLPTGELATYAVRMVSICFSPNGRLIATIDSNGTNRWWDATTFTPTSEPFWQGTSFWGACFRDDGSYYFTIVADFNENHLLLNWLVPTRLAGDPVRGVELNAQLLTLQTPDGQMTVTGSNDGTIVVRDADSQLPRGAEMRHRDAILAVAISADGRTIATGGADATAQLWALSSRMPVGPSLAHGGPVQSVAFRGDGKVLATGSNDGTARLWDATTGTAIGPSLPHSGPVEVVAFDTDGTLLTRGADRMVRRWSIPRAAEGDVDRVLSWVRALSGAELGPEGMIQKIDISKRAIREAILRARERGVPPEP